MIPSNITKIALHGNVTEDIIITIDSFPPEGTNNTCSGLYKRMGGIKNVERALHVIKPRFPMEIMMYGEINDAVIIISSNGVQKKRTSFADWKPAEITELVPNAWNHIAYADKLTCNFTKPENSILSIDFVNRPTEEHTDIIQQADYVFCSLEDFNQIIRNNAKTYILHAPKAVMVKTLEDEYFYNAPNMLSTIPNPVGAGDTFAACMINGIMTHTTLDNTLIEAVYRHTESILKEDKLDKFSYTTSR